MVNYGYCGFIREEINPLIATDTFEIYFYIFNSKTSPSICW